MRLIDADALKELFREVIGHIAKKPEMNGNLEHMIRASAMVIQMIDDAPTVQPDTTTHDSIPAETGKNYGDRTSGDCINRQQAINKIKPWLEVKGYSRGELNMLRAVINELENMPSAQPETSCSEFPNNSDTISRQAAIEAVVGCTNCGTEDVLRAYATKHSLENGWTGGIVDALDAIEQLPPAEPERPTGEWIQKPRYEDDEYPDAQPNLKCPFCGYEIGWCDMGNYCARCGADLKGGAE